MGTSSSKAPPPPRLLPEEEVFSAHHLDVIRTTFHDWSGDAGVLPTTVLSDRFAALPDLFVESLTKSGDSMSYCAFLEFVYNSCFAPKRKRISHFLLMYACDNDVAVDVLALMLLDCFDMALMVEGRETEDDVEPQLHAMATAVLEHLKHENAELASAAVSLEQWIFGNAREIFAPLAYTIFLAVFGDGVGGAPPCAPLPSINSSTLNCCRQWQLGLISGSVDGEATSAWTKLYSSMEHGSGIARFESQVCGFKKSTLLIVHAAGGRCFGAFMPTTWSNHAEYYGSAGVFLFSLFPLLTVLRPSGRDACYVYYNTGAKSKNTLGRSRHPPGIGWGGQMGCWRLFLNEDFTEGEARDVGRTFQGSLDLPDRFELVAVEVYGSGGEDALEELRKGRELKDLIKQKQRKVDRKKFAGNWEDSPDRAIMQMAGLKSYRDGLDVDDGDDTRVIINRS